MHFEFKKNSSQIIISPLLKQIYLKMLIFSRSTQQLRSKMLSHKLYSLARAQTHYIFPLKQFRNGTASSWTHAMSSNSLVQRAKRPTSLASLYRVQSPFSCTLRVQKFRSQLKTLTMNSPWEFC